MTPPRPSIRRGTSGENHPADRHDLIRVQGARANNLKDISVEIPKRRRGETVVKYVADTEGTFVIECSRPCGAGHTAMRATLIVRPAGNGPTGQQAK